MQFINDLNGERHVALLEFPEQPKKTSRRGLSDEERDVEEALWSLRQSCDSRWIVPFQLHSSAEAQSTRRQGIIK